MTEPSQERMILVGANDPLPDDHFWFEGEGFSVYAAKQPRSTWHEHVHDCVQVTVGLEPAHMHAEWRATGKLRQSKEFIGNAVTVIPAHVPHKTLWQRRAALIHIYIRGEFLRRLALDVLQQDSLELQPTYLVRDLLIEELARLLYLESEKGHLNAAVASAAVTTLCVRLLRAYAVRKNEAAYATGGLGPARERRVREYIEADLERDLSIQSLADVVGLSPQHFAVLFRESTGFTPHQYVNHRRIAYAQELLKKDGVPLIEISMQCGFSSQSQFITTFRKLVGMTPGRFRSSLTASR
ncbi:helix-turn-helix transcriptional regulator [Edaphobacter modestus]|uniref:AraC family transcriptional regulator n=1 Tax=Edaphobacter modestus TaxID=388466 RepID=A0A4Q7YP96_9BACT|nr:AraC family transcriptional regulator [Edaphobacter modestus]RZU39240.1 AraC family transcriptional regulator [Edaphobacter modestus]